jgi:cardiolipin synthase
LKLIIQPEAGARPLVKAIQRARKTIDIVVFRFDLDEIEQALVEASDRGVCVRALIAHTNRGGADRLRKLEQRLLKKGITVARTDDDLVRYHGKVFTVDRRTAYVLGFNYTKQDLESRSIGVETKNHRIVKELLRLFDTDANRTEFVSRVREVVVSPENSRARLEAFIQRAKKTIDIYDPSLSDDAMLALLQRKAEKGVRIRILGKLEAKWKAAGFDARPFPGKQLHVRAIIRDGRRAFVGSQSLRKLELDKRREVGLIIREPEVARKVLKTFERDWALTKAR